MTFTKISVLNMIYVVCFCILLYSSFGISLTTKESSLRDDFAYDNWDQMSNFGWKEDEYATNVNVTVIGTEAV